MEDPEEALVEAVGEEEEEVRKHENVSRRSAKSVLLLRPQRRA